jgi:hypothetical protein
MARDGDLNTRPGPWQPGSSTGLADRAAHHSPGDRDRRDFSSAQSLVASRYDIIARGGHAEQARSILQQAGLLTDHAADAAPPQGVADTAP